MNLPKNVILEQASAIFLYAPLSGDLESMSDDELFMHVRTHNRREFDHMTGDEIWEAIESVAHAMSRAFASGHGAGWADAQRLSANKKPLAECIASNELSQTDDTVVLNPSAEQLAIGNALEEFPGTIAEFVHLLDQGRVG